MSLRKIFPLLPDNAAMPSQNLSVSASRPLPMVTDSMEEGNERYLVMEYIEGKNLESYVQEKGHIRQEQAVEWALELATFL